MVAVSSNNPNDTNFLVPSDEFTGVVQVKNTTTGAFCTGTLLAGDGLHILTAAHCFNNQNGSANLTPDPSDYEISFELANGSFEDRNVEGIFVHPSWTSDGFSNYDIAIIKLSEEAPSSAESYEIYRDSDEVNQIFTRLGYGVSGTGATGITGTGELIKRFGNNVYDALGDIFAEPPVQNAIILPGTQLAFDFDSGESQNDAFGQEYGLEQLGVDLEVNSTPGDSGGPAFIDGKIAGITSFGLSPSTEGIDVDDTEINSSFGEYSVDTRISAYASFVDEILGFSVQTGTSGNDTLNGTAGNDTLNGAAGRDQLSGAAGRDLLTGGGGNDTLLGGRGNDTLTGGNGSDTLNGNAGNDTLTGDTGNDNLNGGAGNDTLTGGAGRDTLTGSSGNDNLNGGGANDTITGGTGRDNLNGNAGNDILTGGNGRDRLNGNAGNDTLTGGSGSDTLNGNAGNDILTGGNGRDNLNGNAGNDILTGSNGNDNLNGGAGNDTLTGGGGIDRFIFNTNQQFQSGDIGIDQITDFSQTQEDILLLDLTTFTAINSNPGTGFSIADEFATVTSNQQARTSDAVIVYNTNNGNLFYNPNGSTAGFGNGGRFATLTNIPSLTAEDFFLRS